MLVNPEIDTERLLKDMHSHKELMDYLISVNWDVNEPIAKIINVNGFDVFYSFGLSAEHDLSEYSKLITSGKYKLEKWPDFVQIENLEDDKYYKNAYGTSDNIESIFNLYKNEFSENCERKFIISVKEILKSEESPDGWRWHKWGPYCGIQEPQCEYLYDEPEIESAFIYHIYEFVEVDSKD